MRWRWAPLAWVLFGAAGAFAAADPTVTNGAALVSHTAVDRCVAQRAELEDTLLLVDAQRGACAARLARCEADALGGGTCASAAAGLPAPQPPGGWEAGTLAADLTQIGCLLGGDGEPDLCRHDGAGAVPRADALVGLAQRHSGRCREARRRVADLEARLRSTAHSMQQLWPPSEASCKAAGGWRWERPTLGVVVVLAVAGCAFLGRKHGKLEARFQRIGIALRRCREENDALRKRVRHTDHLCRQVAATAEELEARLLKAQEDNATLRQRMVESTAALKAATDRLQAAEEENEGLRERLRRAAARKPSAPDGDDDEDGEGEDEDAEGLEYAAAVRLLASAAESSLRSQLERGAGKDPRNPLSDRDVAFLADLLGARRGPESGTEGPSGTEGNSHSETPSPADGSPRAGARRAHKAPNGHRHRARAAAEDEEEEEEEDGDADGASDRGVTHRPKANGSNGVTSHFPNGSTFSSSEENEEGDEPAGRQSSDASSGGSAEGPSPAVHPFHSRQWCKVSAHGLAFQLPSVGCRWRSPVLASGPAVTVRRFVPEDRRLATRLTLLLVAEIVPWDMSLATYRDLCKLRLLDTLQDGLEGLTEGERDVADAQCFTVQYVQRRPVELCAHTAMLLRPSIVVAWQVIWKSPRAAIGAPGVAAIADQLLTSVALFPPAPPGCD